MINVFIIDDHKMVIEGLKLLLDNCDDIHVTGFALNGKDGLQAVQEKSVDVILLDVNLPELNGIETCKLLLKQNPNLKIIAISMHKEGSLIKLMLKNGAKGYVLKNAGQDEVIQAIKKVHAGKTYLDDTVNQIILNSALGNIQKKENPFPTLSRREKEVLKLILDECTTQEISEKLFISFGTVETHRRNMMIKLGARNTAGLVRIAIEYDLDK